MTDLEHAILALIRNRGDKVIRARDLYRLPEASRPSDRSSFDAQRYVDQALQRMRRKGGITYDSKLGWRTCVQAEWDAAAEQLKREGRA